MEKDVRDIKLLDIQRKVFRLRHRDGKKWNEISEVINKRFNKEFTSKKVQNIYDDYVAKSSVITSTMKNSKHESLEANREWVSEMKKLLETIKEKALKHLEIADEILIYQYKEGNTNAYFKNLPVAISLFRSLLDQANFLGNRLEKIEVNQKNYILNETQILQVVNKAWDKKEIESGFVAHPGKLGQLVPISELKKKKKIFI